MDRQLVLPHLIERRAREAPDKPFLQDVAGREVTYGELYDTALTWASALRRLGVGPGDTVVTMLPNGFESYFAWLGCAWLGAMEVPINTMNRGRLLQYVIDNSEARRVVVAARYLDQFADVAAALPQVEATVVLDLPDDARALPMRTISGHDFLSDQEPAGDLAGPEHYDTSCIIYTSGTTGPSKGVLVPWAELYQFPAAVPRESLQRDGCLYAVLPTFHVGGKSSLYLTALADARMVIREVFSVSEFLNDVRRFGCTSSGLIGTMAQLILGMPEKPDDADNPLRLVQTAPLFPEIDEFERRFGVEVFTGYGMTEIGAPLFVSAQDRRDWRSCGRVRPGYELRVVDEHDGTVPTGQIGELIIRSDEPWDLNAGYFRRPEATAEAWRNGWFHTGDAFRQDEDGYFFFVDRIKDAMRRKGENISSFEVEGYLREHPDVVEVAAIAVPSDFGPGEDEVKVVVVLREGSDLSPEALLEFLGPRMPRFMLPRYVELVDALPKTSTLRVRKVELRDTPLGSNTWDRERSDYVGDARSG